ncbi:MAG: PP2C family protein-serine/threonine phosphatase [Planctomycetota bacterium]
MTALGASGSQTLTETVNDAVRFRTLGVLGILLAAATANSVRLATASDQAASDVPLGVPLVMGGLILYEFLTFIWLVRIRDRQKPLPGWWNYFNACVEALAPTLLGFIVAWGDDVSLRAAALGPASHMYALFIVLSVLHVRLAVSLVSGLVSGLGLGLMVVVSSITEGSGTATDSLMPRSLEMFSAVLVVATGAAAGIVALRVRGYLGSAVSEAKRRMRAEQDLQAAAIIQRKLMPSESPDVPGFEIVGWNRPADETGGDYFDWLPLDDGRFAVCVADVTGHGLGPAMIACFCRAYGRSALRVEQKLASAVGRLNEELLNDLGDGRFVTFATLLVTPNEGELLCMSAGHGPLLVYRKATKTVESLGCETFPLGIGTIDDSVEPAKHQLAEGDVFVMLTDGFFEWRASDGDFFGVPRLCESLARHGHRAGQDMIDHILADLETFAAGTAQPDDLTAVVIRRVADQHEKPANP